MKVLSTWSRDQQELDLAAPEFYTQMVNFSNSFRGKFTKNKVVNVNGTLPITSINAPTKFKAYLVIAVGIRIFVIGIEGDILAKQIAVYEVTFNTKLTVATYTLVTKITNSLVEQLDIYFTATGHEETQKVSKVYLNIVQKQDSKFVTSEGFTLFIRNNVVTIMNDSCVEISLSPCKFSNIIVGKLGIGSYRYAYRLVAKNGYTSNWSPYTKQVDLLFKYPYGLTGTAPIDIVEDYQKIISSGFGIQIQVTVAAEYISTGFTHMEILRMYTYNPDMQPIYEIINVLELVEGDITITNIDNYRVISVVTPLDAKLKKFPYKYALSAVYKNYTFIGNILEPEIFPNIDMRAYQFLINSSMRKITQSSQNLPTLPIGSYTLSSTDFTKVISDTTGQEITLPVKRDTDTQIYGYAPGTDIPGAMGTNIAVVFSYEYVNAKWDKYTYKLIELENSPADFRCVQHDSVYRLGIVFRTFAGKETPVYYIGDIQTPTMTTEVYHNMFNHSNPDGVDYSNIDVDGHRLVKKLTMKVVVTLPKPPVYKYARVVYVKRQKSDIKNVGMGISFQRAVMDGTNKAHSEAIHFLNTAISSTPFETVTQAVFVPERSYDAFSLDNQQLILKVLGTVSSWSDEKRTHYSPKMRFRIPWRYPNSIHAPYGYEMLFKQHTPLQGESNKNTFGSAGTSMYEYANLQHSDWNLQNAPEAIRPFARTELGKCLIGGRVGTLIDIGSNTTVDPNLPNIIVLQQAPIREKTGYLNLETETFEPFSDWVEIFISNENPNIRVARLTTYGDAFVGIYVAQCTQYLASPQPMKHINYSDSSIPVATPAETSYWGVFVESLVNVQRGSISYETLYEMDNTKLTYLRDTNNTKFDQVFLGVSIIDNEYAQNSLTDDPEHANFDFELPDFYAINSVYNKLLSDAVYFIQSSVADGSTVFPTMIRYSDPKVLGEFYDSWLTFRTNNFAELTSIYGQLTALIVFQEKLLAFQDRTIHMLWINETMQTVTTTGETLALGMGDLLGADGGKVSTIIVTNVGCPLGTQFIESQSSLYWLDPLNRHIYRFTGQGAPIPITLLNGITDLFVDTINKDTRLLGVYDGTTSDVYLTIVNTENGLLTRDYMFTIGWLAPNQLTCTGDTSNLNIVVGQVVIITHAYPKILGKVLEITSTYVRFATFNSNDNYYLLQGSNINLLIHKEKLKAFTIVYNELDSTFKYITTMHAGFYMKHARELFVIKFTEDAAVPIGTDGAQLYKLSDKAKNTFFGERHPSKVSFIVKVPNTAKGSSFIKWVSEFDAKDIPGNIGFNTSTTKTFSAISASELKEVTDVIPLIPKNASYLEHYPDGQNSNMNLDDPQPSASLPMLFTDENSINYPAGYNCENRLNTWTANIPFIRSYADVNSIISAEPLPDNPIYESLRNEWILITLYYFPSNATDIIKLNKIE